MARLTVAARKKLPLSVFGMPKTRGWPMQDAAHAANAKARATQAVDAGRMSVGTEKRLDAKANRVERGAR